MQIYLNELAPWETENEYYNQIELGNNLKDQPIEIKDQTKNLVLTQLKTSSAIIASQERINEGIDALCMRLRK